MIAAHHKTNIREDGKILQCGNLIIESPSRLQVVTVFDPGGGGGGGCYSIPYPFFCCLIIPLIPNANVNDFTP